MHPITRSVWEALGRASSAWLRSNEGRQWIARSLWHVRRVAGRNDARMLRDLITLAATVPFDDVGEEET